MERDSNITLYSYLHIIVSLFIFTFVSMPLSAKAADGDIIQGYRPAESYQSINKEGQIGNSANIPPSEPVLLNPSTLPGSDNTPTTIDPAIPDGQITPSRSIPILEKDMSQRIPEIDIIPKNIPQGLPLIDQPVQTTVPIANTKFMGTQVSSFGLPQPLGATATAISNAKIGEPPPQNNPAEQPVVASPAQFMFPAPINDPELAREIEAGHFYPIYTFNGGAGHAFRVLRTDDGGVSFQVLPPITELNWTNPPMWTEVDRQYRLADITDVTIHGPDGHEVVYPASATEINRTISQRRN